MSALLEKNTLRSEHIHNQLLAADPIKSVWVTANAGAGKTRVLIDRIMRMLLPPFDTPPSKILCMTFTKAAASEMSERLFDRLGEWISLEDDLLFNEIKGLTGHSPSQNDLISARRLFAKALEAPGGLKIQTIHGFCESILRRFPIEAGIPPDFSVIQDTQTKQLLAKSLDDIILSRSPMVKKAIYHLGKTISLPELLDLLKGSLHHYADLQEPFDLRQIATLFNLCPNKNVDDLCQDFIQPLDITTLQRIISAFASGGVTDQKISDKFKILLQYHHASFREQFYLCEGIFLTATKGLHKKPLGTKKIQENFPDLCEYLFEITQKYKKIYDQIDLMALYKNNEYLHVLMQAVFDHYQTLKDEKALFNFDDIIVQTKKLLSNKTLSAWVLYKLDGGIEHILVDEAQDTSPKQWEIIRAITDEFFTTKTNQSSSEAVSQHTKIHDRTFFAVGDEKQSIYSFQGADPHQMPQNKQYYHTAILGHNKQWLSANLKGSFRSAPAITSLVDYVFSTEDSAKGVQFHDQKVEHHAIQNKGPGYIKLNPPVRAQKPDEQSVWTLPLDQSVPEEAKNILARNVVLQIKNILETDFIIPSTGKKAQPKDILILLRTRGALQKLIIKELKHHNIPTAGADRIDLLDNIAILDLIAAMKFTLCPQDDLTLAALLKSPLCGLDEEDLFDLCHNREGTLLSALKTKQDEQPQYQTSFDFIQKMRQSKSLSSPYDFLQNILISLGGKQKLLNHLGQECLEAIEALLNKSLAFEADSPPSLQAFLHDLMMEGAKVKKDPDQSADEVRIMTIHGAKGLEAPIVFLPDTTGLPTIKFHDKLTPIDATYCPLWLRGSQNADVITDIKSRATQNDMDEYRRLLYVALTRARDMLFIDGVLGTNKLPEHCWYRYIRDGVKQMPNVVVDDADMNNASYEYNDPPNLEQKSPDIPLENLSPYIHPPLPQWAKTQNILGANEAVDNYEEIYLNPSIAGGGYEGDTDNDAVTKGNIIHKILEIIPQIQTDHRKDAATQYLENYTLPPHRKTDILKEIFQLLDHPDMQNILDKNGFSEVPMLGKIKKLDISVSGQIDRMVFLEENKILLADYKSDYNLGDIQDIKPDYILQMALYRLALMEIYPNKIIQTMIIGTRKGCLLTIPDDLLDAAIMDMEA